MMSGWLTCLLNERVEQNQPQLLSWGSEEMMRNLDHPRPLKKERMLHEPQNERLIKSELMAKAGICLEIVFTSLKAGANFKTGKNIEPKL